MNNSDPPKPVGAFLDHTFTHIVVGGGTAGLVVASRLSENPTITVGVLEAGFTAFDEPRINVPGRFGESLGTEYDWQFETTQQEGLNNRVLPWARGRVLGGSSALNFMTWNRGCKEDYDAWEALGAEGWGWEGLMPYFKKSENFAPSSVDHQKLHSSYHDVAYHGIGGPMQTTYSAEFGASHQHWHATLDELGVHTNRSHFSGSNVGAWTTLTTVTPELRERNYSATAYYKPNSGRENLILLTGAFVQKIILEQEAGEWKAKGVDFTYQGRKYPVKTQGEVIICAGTVQSPQLLEVSGIGNPDILKAAGIEVKAENPNVGENLQDHLMTDTVYEIDPSITTTEDLHTDPILAAAADEAYASTHSGPRTLIPSSIAYLPFSHFTSSEALQNLHSSVPNSNTLRDKILLDRLVSEKKLGQIEYNFDLSNYNPYFRSEPGKKYATMLMMLQYPFSKGSIHLPPMDHPSNNNSSSDDHNQDIPKNKPGPSTMSSKPIIDPRYFAGPGGAVDLQTMLQSQYFSHKICTTPPLSSMIKKRVFPPERAPSPQPETQTQLTTTISEEDLTTWILNTMVTDWHPVGTCAMGGDSGSAARDGGFVVDSRLRVYGTKGLRVVDASVMPLIIAAHLQATVYAIGEKGADMIKEDWVSGDIGKGRAGERAQL